MIHPPSRPRPRPKCATAAMVAAVLVVGAVVVAAPGTVAADRPGSGQGGADPAPAVTSDEWRRAVAGLEPGKVGPRVQALQEMLTEAGVAGVGGADGVYGPMTTEAVEAFQRAQGLAVSGRVDQATADALLQAVGAAGAPATPAPAEAPAPAAPTSTGGLVGLAVGSQGPPVAQVQEALLNAGLRFSGGVDGIFGPATASALSEFQQHKGLPVTGQVDATTAAALEAPGAIVAATPATTGAPGATRAIGGLAPGSVGNNVRALQQALLGAGITFPGGDDGIFGPATANALKEFQRTRGLEATGRVDGATEAALLAQTPAVPSTSTSSGGSTGRSSSAGFPVFGEHGARVRAMQQALLDAGLTFSGGADGIFGSQTAGAIMSYQRREGLTVTGVLDAATAALLGLSEATAPPAPSTTGVELEVFPIEGPCTFIDTWHAPRGGGRVHEGVDFMAPEGRAIYAVTAGTITHVYVDRPGSLAGNGVRLEQPDGTYFFYAHLDAVADGIEVGTKVTAGQVLGTNGATGNAGVPHLHFEVHPQGGAAVNPYPLVRALGNCG